MGNCSVAVGCRGITGSKTMEEKDKCRRQAKSEYKQAMPMCDVMRQKVGMEWKFRNGKSVAGLSVIFMC